LVLVVRFLGFRRAPRAALAPVELMIRWAAAKVEDPLKGAPGPERMVMLQLAGSEKLVLGREVEERFGDL